MPVREFIALKGKYVDVVTPEEGREVGGSGRVVRVRVQHGRRYLELDYGYELEVLPESRVTVRMQRGAFES